MGRMHRWLQRIAVLLAVTLFVLGVGLWWLGARWNPFYARESWVVDGDHVHYFVYQASFGGGRVWAHRSYRRWILDSGEAHADFNRTHAGSSGAGWSDLPDRSWWYRPRGNSRLNRVGLFYERSVNQASPSFVNISWIVTVPYWILLLPGLAGPYWVGRMLRWRRQQRWRVSGRCTGCGYDLRATLDRCPECGAISGVAAESHFRSDGGSSTAAMTSA